MRGNHGTIDVAVNHAVNEVDYPLSVQPSVSVSVSSRGSANVSGLSSSGTVSFCFSGSDDSRAQTENQVERAEDLILASYRSVSVFHDTLYAHACKEADAEVEKHAAAVQFYKQPVDIWNLYLDVWNLYHRLWPTIERVPLAQCLRQLDNVVMYPNRAYQLFPGDERLSQVVSGTFLISAHGI
jgi:hypothetical protein